MAWLHFADLTEGSFDPVVLVWGDMGGLLLFRDFLRQLPLNGVTVRLNDLHGCESVDGTVLVASLKPNGRGLRKASEEPPRRFEWEIDPENLQTFAELIEIVALGTSGHHYLEGRFDVEDLEIMVSKGEYGQNFRP